MPEIPRATGAPSPEPELGLCVIFKGSNRCNARCVFCSVGEAGATSMAWDDFELVAREIHRLVDHWGVTRLGFTFHGGEPTLLGPEFIDRACRRIREIPVRHDFTMQSNLIWRDEELMQTLERHEVRLGTSVDPIVGDRRNPRGEDAFPDWLEGFLSVAQRGSASAPGAIFVVTRKALGQAERLYRIAESIGDAAGEPFGLQLNPVYQQGRAADTPDVLVTAREFGEFLVEMYDLWERSGRSVSLTPIQQIADAFPRPLDGKHLSCTFAPSCSRTHVGIDFDLNVAGCGRRLDSAAFLGNLRDHSLIALVEGSNEQQAIAQRAELLRERDPECRSCDYFQICHGGCPDDTWLNCGDVSGRFGWCESYHMLFETMEARLGNGNGGSRPRTPRGRQVPEHVEVRPALEAGDLREAGDGGRVDYWLLPTNDGVVLQFDSGLDFPRGRRPLAMRLWIHNRHTKRLVLWEGLLQRRGVSVVLFEADGLEESLNLLNALNATVYLDVVRILEVDGAAALQRVFERYVADPLWKARIFPFSAILENAMRDSSVQFVTRWGLSPGAFHVRPLEGRVSGTAAAIIDELQGDAGRSLAAWMLERRPCLECDVRKICGGCLAPGTGEACHPVALKMVRDLQRVAADIREQWETSAAK